MVTPSVNMAEDLQTEIDGRRPSTVSRAAYIREAILVRMLLEDLGEWDDFAERAPEEESFGAKSENAPADD